MTAFSHGLSNTHSFYWIGTWHMKMVKLPAFGDGKRTIRLDSVNLVKLFCFECLVNCVAKLTRTHWTGDWDDLRAPRPDSWCTACTEYGDDVHWAVRISLQRPCSTPRARCISRQNDRTEHWWHVLSDAAWDTAKCTHWNCEYWILLVWQLCHWRLMMTTTLMSPLWMWSWVHCPWDVASLSSFENANERLHWASNCLQL